MNKAQTHHVCPLILLIAIITFTGCSQKETRDSYYQNPDNPVVIGVAYPFSTVDSDTRYLDGINLAVSQVNQRGGIQGREVVILRRDDKSSVNTGSEIAQNFVDDPSVAAVIGHWNSGVSLPVSAIYEANEMVMFTAASTNPALTQSGYRYIFRGIPDDEMIGRSVSDKMHAEELSRIAIVYTNDDYGRGLANAFEQRTYELGSLVVDRIAGITTQDIPDLIKVWKALKVEAIFIAAVMPEAGEIIRQVRARGVNLPIYSGTGLDRTTSADALGDYRKNVKHATLLDSTTIQHENEGFITAFKEKYEGADPDSWSILGYEAVSLLAQAMNQTASTFPLPEETAEALRSLQNVRMISGVLSCLDDGEFTGHTVYMRDMTTGSVTAIEEEE